MKFVCKKNSPYLSQALQYVSQLDHEKDWEITVKPYKKNLTTSQRNYFHKLIDILCEYTGDDTEDMKTRVCFSLGLTKIVTLKDGRCIEQRLSTERLTREQYSELIDAVTMACMSLELQIPTRQQYDI